MSAVLCPRCRSEVDVSAFAPGSTVRCNDCGGMLRVPTGRTGVNPSVPPAAEERKASTKVRVPAAEGGRSITRTRVRAVGSASETRMRSVRSAPRSSSNNGLLVGLLVGALLVIVGLVFLLASNTTPPPAPPVVQRPPAPPPLPPPVLPASAAAVEPPKTEDVSPPPMRGGDPAKANWDQIMTMLRPGGGFDDPGRPEGAAFMKVKAMGKEAYPYLIRFIDHEDVLLGRAAVTVLNELTGRNAPGRPTDATKAAVKADWEAWVKANP